MIKLTGLGDCELELAIAVLASCINHKHPFVKVGDLFRRLDSVLVVDFRRKLDVPLTLDNSPDVVLAERLHDHCLSTQQSQVSALSS